MRQRRESHSGVASSMVHKRKEDRRREAIGFEIQIPVTRGAFDRRERSTDDEWYLVRTPSLAEMSGETQITRIIATPEKCLNRYELFKHPGMSFVRPDKV